MAVDYIRWIEDTLRKKPHLTQSGLARHLGRDRSVIVMIRKGKRSLKADEIAKIADYLGEPPPGHGLPSQTYVSVVGRIGTGWYEPGDIPTSDRKVAPVLERDDVRQEAYEVDTRVMDVPAGSVLIATPIERGNGARDGSLAVIRRSKAGLTNLSLGHVGDDDGEPIAVVIEVRIPVA